jgi:FeS assembly protein IscX
MRWTDVYDIAAALVDNHPEFDTQKVQWIRFTDLHSMVVDLSGFADDPLKSNEKILEAIQATWLEELA